MEIKVTHKDNMTLVFITVEITSTNAEEFEKAIASEPDSTDGIIINARFMNYISSAGLRVILAAKKTLRLAYV